MKAAKLRLDPEYCQRAFTESTLKALNPDVTDKKLHYDKHMKRVMKKMEKGKT